MHFLTAFHFFLFQVKKSIKAIRDDTTERIWQQTNRMDFLKMENWTQETIKHLEVGETVFI